MPNKPKNHEERRSLTSRVDRQRWEINEQHRINTLNKYNAICSMTTTEQIRLEINKCFPLNKHKVIREFFMTHPVCWTDIQRKIHALKKYNNEKKEWYIEERKLWEIYGSFLTRGRKSNIWEKIHPLLPYAITENQELLTFAGAQPSLLDEGWYMFSQMHQQKRIWLIRNLILTGISKNIDNYTYFNIGNTYPKISINWKTNSYRAFNLDSIITKTTDNPRDSLYENIDPILKEIFPKLLKYIEDIFWKKINHLKFSESFNKITKALDTMIGSWHGEQRESAFRIIQAFHAWASINEIKEVHDIAQKKIEHIPKLLKKIWIQIDGNIESIDHNEAIIHQTNILIDWKKYRMEWRVKTVKSILQKMWETEEYTNKDAIRDMVGIHFIWPNDTTSDEKKNIIARFWMLMPDFWFLLKDKWWLWDEIHNVANNLKDHKKNPVHVSFKLWSTSDPNINNTSISGFMPIDGESLWTEIQFSDEKWAEWKKKNDKVYKPKGMLTVLMRGAKFATPRDCYILLNNRIKSNILQELWYKDINSMLLAYIEEEKFLIPYISENASELLITCKSKEDEFRKKFPNMHKCDIWNIHYEKVKTYILWLRI